MLDTFGHMQYLYGNTVGIASTFYFDSNSGFLLGFSWQYLGLRFWRSVIICNSQHTEFGWIWTNQIFWIIYGQSWLSWIALDNVYIFFLYYISHVLVSFLFPKRTFQRSTLYVSTKKSQWDVFSPFREFFVRCARKKKRRVMTRLQVSRYDPARSYDGIDSIRHLTNFGRSVLGCIEAYDSETRRIFQHFSKSTRCAFLCTTRNSIFCKKIVSFFCKFCYSSL